MNKARLNKLAAEQAAKSGAPRCAAPAATRPMQRDDLLLRFYAHLVGSADFIHTQAGEAEVCRVALARARVALRVWLAAHEPEA